MAVPTWAVGQVLAAADVNSWFVPLVGYKSADQSVTSSTVLINDSALLVPVAANALYLVTCYLSYEGGTQGSSDMKFQFTGPAGSAMSFNATYYPTSGGVGANTNLSRTTGLSSVVPVGTDGTGVKMPMVISGTFSTGAFTGNLQMQWAQNTSSATSTTMHAGSVLAASRIG